MSRIAAALIVAAAILVAPSIEADADTPGCATWGEYQRIEQGWAPRRVKRVLDTGGFKLYPTEYGQVRGYPVCSDGQTVIVEYLSGGVLSKHWSAAECRP